jgi:hypothetical protein
VNNWKLPEAKSGLKDTKLAKKVSEVSVAFLKVWHLDVLIACRHTDQDVVLRRRVFKRGPGLNVHFIALHYPALEVNNLNSLKISSRKHESTNIITTISAKSLP